jgi:probable F420-dependent oxidoreductase
MAVDLGLGKTGVWYAADKLQPAEWREFVAHIEDCGYGTLWHSEATGFEAMAFGAFLLSHTSKLKIGTAIANIYARDAVASRNGLRTLNQFSDGRYVLGLGISHIPMVENFRGHSYGKPLASMREYLAAMAAGQDEADQWPLLIAALGPKMLELAASATRGCIPYNVTPEHTARARAAMGDDGLVVVEQKFCLEQDPAKALELARGELARYMVLPNYRNNWLSLGFTQDDLANGGNERFLNAMVVWGDEGTVRARVQAHRDAGADHVCIQPVHAPGDLAAAKRMLSAMAGV